MTSNTGAPTTLPLPTNIRRIQSPDTSLLKDLCTLLQDSVNNGASVGFLSPIEHSTALHYWEHTLESLGSGLALWVAKHEGRIVGSVQLSLCGKDNGRHRAEVQKLFVLTPYRGQGIASRLMGELESFARADGRTLLVLDTQAGSVAETLYQHLSWQRVGEIPSFAASPNGELHATAIYYKQLPP